MAFPPQNSNQIVPSTPQHGTGFTNLQKVLAANQNNRLGSTIAQGLTNSAQGVQQQLGSQVNQFNQAAGAADLGSTANMAQKQAALQNIANGGASPSDSDVSLFARLRGGNYTGPTGLDQAKSAGLYNTAQNIQGIGQGLTGGGDKTQALRAYVSQSPNYTAGEQKLDTSLLGAPAQAKQLASARRAGAGLPGQIQAQENTANQVGQQYQNKATQTANQTKADLGLDTSGNLNLTGTGLIPQLYQSEQAKATQYNTDQQNAYNSFLQRVQDAQKNNGTLSNADLQTLGFTRPASGSQSLGEQRVQTYGVDLSNPNLYTQQTAATASSAANAADRAKLAALSQLAGTQANSVLDPNAAIYDPTKPFTPNTEGTTIQGAISGAQQQYQNALNTATIPAAVDFSGGPQINLTDRINQTQDRINLLKSRPPGDIEAAQDLPNLQSYLQQLNSKYVEPLKQQYGYYKGV